MKFSKRAITEPGSASAPAVVGICLGSALFVVLVMVSICLILRRRSKRRQLNHGSVKQFLLSKDVKPVISMKTAAGPGGLKKSPSPLQSPENPEKEWSRRSSAMDHSTLSEGHTDETTTGGTVVGGGTEEGHKVISDKKGELNFSLRYNFEKNALQVTIVSATNLCGSGENLLDPYVKLQLLPEKQHKVKTRVVRNTLCPVYEEEFTFYGINYNQLQSTTLHFVVVAFDRYSRDEILGEVICPLHTVDLSDSDQQASLSMELMSHTLKFQNSQHRGELLVSLCYQPANNKVTAVVLKAKNLPKFDITGLADPYVKVYMLYNGQKLAKKKTHVKKRTLTPVYNESFVFDLPTSDPAALEQISFEFLVMDWDRVTKNEVMGKSVIGCEAKSTSGKAHWDQVRRNPRRPFAEWHRLRP